MSISPINIFVLSVNHRDFRFIIYTFCFLILFFFNNIKCILTKVILKIPENSPFVKNKMKNKYSTNVSLEFAAKIQIEKYQRL